MLGIEYDCALVLSDVCLIENYSAKGTDNPIIFNNICPLKYNKRLVGEKEILYFECKFNDRKYIYCEQADEYYGFKYLIVCLLSGEIVETLGYYEKELFTICEEIMIESAKEI